MLANPMILKLLADVLNEATQRSTARPPPAPATQPGKPSPRPPAVPASQPTTQPATDPLKLAQETADKSVARQDDQQRLLGATVDPQGTEAAFDKARYIKEKPERLAQKRVDAWKRFGGPEPSRQDFELTGTTREEALAARKELAAKNRKSTAWERLGRAAKGVTGSTSMTLADGRNIDDPSRPLTLDERFELLRRGAAGLL